MPHIRRNKHGRGHVSARAAGHVAVLGGSHRRPPPPACQRWTPGCRRCCHRRLSALAPPSCTQKVKRVRCETSAAMVPKDKAIKRFVVGACGVAGMLRNSEVSSWFAS